MSETFIPLAWTNIADAKYVIHRYAFAISEVLAVASNITESKSTNAVKVSNNLSLYGTLRMSYVGLVSISAGAVSAIIRDSSCIHQHCIDQRMQTIHYLHLPFRKFLSRAIIDPRPKVRLRVAVFDKKYEMSHGLRQN